jgi:hypothetical protein
LEIGGKTVLHVRPGADGLLSVDLDLENESGLSVVTMEDSGLRFVPEAVRDLSVSASGHHIKVWLEERRIGLECRFSRITLTEFERLLAADQPQLSEQELEWVSSPEPIRSIDTFYQELSRIDDVSAVARIGMHRSDPVGTFVRWHAARHLDGDGMIPLLDLISCRLRHNARVAEMRSGRHEQMHFCAGNRFSVSGSGGFSMS